MFPRQLSATITATLMLALSACSGSTESAADGQTIVVFGASGNIGGLIVADALERGHSVVGISRSPENLTIEHESFTGVRGDVTDVESFRAVTQGADAVIISVQGAGADNDPSNAVHAQSAVTAAAALAGAEDAPYVLQIGGATTMFETQEAMLASVPFPVPEGSELYAMVVGHLRALNTYRNADIEWTVLTPPFEIHGWSPQGIVDATALGSYRTSTTDILLDNEGKRAGIMVADLATAAVDEVENRQFVRQRFTAAN